MLYHTLKTYCHCLICGEATELSEEKIPDGYTLPIIEPSFFGWSTIQVSSSPYHICPKHNIEVLIDGKTVPELSKTVPRETFKKEMQRLKHVGDGFVPADERIEG